MTTEKPKYGIERALGKALQRATVGPRLWLAAQLGISARRLAGWIKDDPASALQKCAEAAGSQVALARILGVSQRTVSVWIAADLPDRNTREPANAVQRAVEKAGGQPAMAEELGVTQQSVSEWCKQGYVPSGRAATIAIRYGVPRAELINPKLRKALGAGGEL